MQLCPTLSATLNNNTWSDEPTIREVPTQWDADDHSGDTTLQLVGV